MTTRWSAMSVTQISLLCSFLLFCLLVVRLKWEIPVDFGEAWLLVVGGFPCHRHSIYENYAIPPARAGQSSASEIVYRLPWKCDSLTQPEDVCLTILSQCPVGNASQYSFDSWSDGNTTCKKGGRRVECSPVRVERGVCQNIVTKMANYTNTIQISLEDYALPSPIIQRFETFPDDLDESLCYQTGDPLSARAPQAVGQPQVFNLSLLQFNVNATYKRVVEERASRPEDRLEPAFQDCDSLRRRLNPGHFLDSMLCNCERCEIAILSEIGPPNGTCVVPATWELVIPTENGRVIGAVLKLSWRDVDVSRPLVVTYKATYPPYSSTVVNSRFWSTRGRFYCPSEVTCWEELWYPLKGWSELKTSHVVTLLIVAAISALLIWI